MSVIGRLALGTVQFGLTYGISNKGGQSDQAEVSNILNTAWVAGIRMIDTARAYGNSEENLAKVNRHDFKVVTKFPADTNPDNLDDVFSASLSALRVTKVYGYIAHDFNSLIKYPETWEKLREYKDKGLIEKIGYSLYNPQDLEILLDKGFIPDIVQVPYNFADRRFEPLFQMLKQHRVEIHCRSAFLQGLLLMDPAELKHSFFNPIKPLLRDLRALFKNIETLAATLMGWVLMKSEVDYLVFGVNTASQLEMNLRAMEKADSTVLQELALPELPADILLPYKWPKD